MPTFFVFGTISSQAKTICDAKVTEVEEALEEYQQLIQYSGDDVDLTKSLTDHVMATLRLLTLRREYLKTIIPDGTLKAGSFSKIRMYADYNGSIRARKKPKTFSKSTR
jgi:hypothetical protein